MSFSLFLLMAGIVIACLAFGYSEGKRVNPQHKELEIRTLFEIALVQQQLEAAGKYADLSEVELLQVAASLAGAKYQVFKKQYAKHQETNNSREKET
ncbi:MAG: hypothetical protein NC218_03670 [Acetobacter sp.]|nr:hypothetical protein [Acetobacter sp.]